MIKAVVMSFGRLLGKTIVRNKKELSEWLDENSFTPLLNSGTAGLETKTYYYKKKKKGTK